MDTNNGGKDELPDQSKASKKGRSCKGTLYYSSALKSKAYNPLCVGIPRAIPEDDHEVPQTQRQQPTQSAGSLFFNRFTRNADLVASGVTKNIRRVGKYVKGSIYEFLYSYRGRPK